jgi:hypothetical protein
LYVTFVGPQGVIRKSTSIGYADDLLSQLPKLERAPAALTVPVLLERLTKSDDSSVYIISSEFSTLIQKSGPQMYEILTDLFDGRKSIDEQTVGRGYNFAENPVVNMLAATTPAWISENMSQNILGGGYGSRVIYINENVRRQHIMYYHKRANPQELDKLQDKLVADLQHIAENINGEFEIDDEAIEFMENWYSNNSDAPPGTDPKLIGFYQRKPAHIHKLAMLLHIATSDELVLRRPDFELAIKEVEFIEKNIAMTFARLGKNIYAADMEGIYQFLKDRGRTSQTDVHKQFLAMAEPNKLLELLEGLKMAGMIKMEYVAPEFYYEVTA